MSEVNRAQYYTEHLSSEGVHPALIGAVIFRLAASDDFAAMLGDERGIYRTEEECLQGLAQIRYWPTCNALMMRHSEDEMRRFCRHAMIIYLIDGEKVSICRTMSPFERISQLLKNPGVELS